MTARQMIKLLSSLDESAKDKEIEFCHNTAEDIFDVYTPEYEDSCSISKNTVTIYIKKKVTMENNLYKIEPYDYSCGCRNFTIKGKEADIYDFGEMVDFDPEHAPDYGCGDKGFRRHDNMDVRVLEKYNITSDEYFIIINALKETLHVGYCALCE